LKSIEARFTAGTSVMDTQGTLTLTAVSNDQFFQGVVITSDQPNSVKLKITSLTAMGSDSNWLTAPREFILSNDKPITINELVGNATTGSEGVKMGTLRSFFMDKPITLMGTLLYTGPNGGESDPIVIKIYL
ncbi:MAG: hypothetical protein Q8898_16570, partial [Bacillota bacterium]|nr:hypothetical protein [Bacillota bacterium]